MRSFRMPVGQQDRAAGYHCARPVAGAGGGNLMADQTRHQDQQREQRAPARDQDRNQQNMGNRDREPAEGSRDRSSQDQGNRNSGNQSPGKQNMGERNSGR